MLNVMSMHMWAREMARTSRRKHKENKTTRQNSHVAQDEVHWAKECKHEYQPYRSWTWLGTS